MNVPQAKAYLLLALANLTDEAVEPPPPPPPPPQPVEPRPAPSGQGLDSFDNAEVRGYLPISISGYFTVPGFINAEAMAGGGGQAIITYLRKNGGDASAGPRWDISPGSYQLDFHGGKPGVQYSLRWYPKSQA